MILHSFSVRTMYPDVHAKSLGECPTPAARTLRPSRLASSRMSAQWYSVDGSNTASGEQV